MRIGFDAKRAFLNKSGLGSYSRNLINALSEKFPQTEFCLYTPSAPNDLFTPCCSNTRVHLPESFLHRKLSSCWRSYALSDVLVKDKIDLFHGLSHEIPFGFPVGKVKSVVTIHDLIFLRLPHLYRAADRIIYNRKFRYACQTADRIIAISRQTAVDISEFFGVDQQKIEVIYQGCHPVFYKPLPSSERDAIRKQYQLPGSYILYVGTIEERKNLLTLLHALATGKIDIPLVVIGKPTRYAGKVMDFLRHHQSLKVIFHNSVSNTDLPGFYQLADLFVYPSVYEGFGLPVLEALASGTPVVTTKNGCFSEAGGPTSLYVDPLNPEELADAIRRVLEESRLRQKMRDEGLRHAGVFDSQSVADNVMKVYKKVLQYE
jgi:glycosyltransferase involved in cell wall biosynthesis